MKKINQTPRYTIIIHKIRIDLELSCNEYCVADVIFSLSNNPDSKIQGWCWATRKKIGEFLGISERAIKDIITRLIKKGMVEKDEETKYLKTTSLWYNSVVLERLKMKNVQREETSLIGKKVPFDGEETSLRKGEETSYNNTNSNNTNINIGLPSSTSRKEMKFKPDDYNKVIAFYEQLKEVKFQGREYKPIQQDIKTMFMSGRKPDEIIRCMKWFKEKSENGEKKYEWVGSWTIKTIRLKIAEFLAGKLGEGEIEKIPEYAKSYIK